MTTPKNPALGTWLAITGMAAFPAWCWRTRTPARMTLAPMDVRLSYRVFVALVMRPALRRPNRSTAELRSASLTPRALLACPSMIAALSEWVEEHRACRPCPASLGVGVIGALIAGLGLVSHGVALQLPVVPGWLVLSFASLFVLSPGRVPK